MMDFNIIQESTAIINYDDIYTQDNYMQLQNELEQLSYEMNESSKYHNNNSKTIETDVNKIPILQWNRNNVFDWMYTYVHKYRHDANEFQIYNFNHIQDGTDLCSMSLEQFFMCDPVFGEFLYEGVQSFLNNSHILNILPSLDSFKCSSDESYSSLESGMFDMNAESPFKCDDSDEFYQNSDLSDLPTVLPSSDEDDSESIVEHQKIVKRGRGRPPGKSNSAKRKLQTNTMGRLWEFIRNLLLNPNYCPSIIKWENYEEGTFRFVRTEKVAELWGSRKSNGKMTYEKLSRALRYYYRTNVFQPVLGRRLVYKFGPAAYGWRTENPNFEMTKQ